MEKIILTYPTIYHNLYIVSALNNKQLFTIDKLILFI